jgi:hypothetical protein
MNPKTSSDLFNKIRSQFANITIGNNMGEATADPNEAVFFDFEFKEDADTFGRISVSLADDESMKVFYNRNLVDKIDEDSRDEWYAFLKELKDFAVEHQLGFDVRDITKNNLTKQDYKNIADTNKTVNTDDMSEELNRLTSLAGIQEVSDMGMNKYGLAAKHEKGKFHSYKHGKLTGTFDSMEELQKHQAELIKNESVTEGLSGTSKSSFENLDKTRLIIRHTGKVDETVPGARSRQIQSLYIENEDGERFKYPMTHLAGARAMSRHVANGGRPHDEFGEHIVRTSEDIAKLNSFSRYVTNKDQLNDNAGDVIEQTKLKLENLRSYMKNLSKQGHYETASKDFKTADEVVLDDETANNYKEKFTMKNLDSRVEEALPLIHKIMSEYKPDDKPKDIGEPIDAPEEPQVDHGAIVQSYLTDPESRLVLRKDDTADKMLSVTKFNDKNTLLGSVLSDIASRMLTKTNVEDRVANFASRIADLVSQEGEPFFKPDADYPKNKKIAIQLARRYIDDYNKMKKDPAYADQVRMDPAKFNPKKDLKGKAKETEAFENWVNNIDEYAKEPKDQEDKDAKLKALQDIQMDPNTAKDSELADKMKQRKKELMQKTFPEGLTFEDIKPYVSMYKDPETGKMTNDVLDKDGNSVFKTTDAKVAMAYLSKNFAKMRSGELKGASKEEAQEEAQEINSELDRITTLANYK